MSAAPEFFEQLRRDGFVRDAQARLTPLNGGVSSEIYLVEDGTEKFVVKRALAKLKVRDDWFANVGRNATERDYLECVGGFLPAAVPQLRFANRDAGYFGMEFLGDGFANWKKILLGGIFETRHAELAGKILGEIHRKTFENTEIQRRFDTTENFRQLRLALYLLTTGERQPDLRKYFVAEAERLAATRECLVHGDFSPKNILISGGRMVLLDCEVAWYGDAAFDIAFLLNHFFLKGLYHAPLGGGMSKLVDAFWRAYLAARQSAAQPLESRVTHLLMLLLLARVDGKSPVEYLKPKQQDFIRNFVRGHLPASSGEISALATDWFAQTKSM